MKKTIISLILVAFAIIGLVFLLKMKKVDAPAPVVQNPGSGESKYLVTHEPTMVSVAEDSFLVGISGSYPQFTQADAAFNAKIAKTVTDGVADFKKTANDNYQAQLKTGGDDFAEQFAATGGYTYKIETQVVQSNDNVISVLIRTEGFSGGAHGFHGIATFNYDVKTKKEMTFADFIRPFMGTLPGISSEVRAELKKKFVTEGNFDKNLESMMSDGTDPKKPENFQSFTFDNDRYTLYFSEYQVAPYVYGEQSVTFDYLVEPQS